MNDEDQKSIGEKLKMRVQNQIQDEMRKESIVNFGIDVLIIVFLGISIAGLCFHFTPV